MLRLSKFSQLAAAAKNAMTSRDAATTLQNLETINASVQKLTATVNAYKGGLLAAAGISSDDAKVGQDIKNSIADSNASEMVSVEEAKAVIKYIEESLEPSIVACMSALKAKKELLAASNLQSTVLGDTTDLRKLTNDFGVAMLKKAPETEQADGKKALAKIDAHFEDAIKVFQAA